MLTRRTITMSMPMPVQTGMSIGVVRALGW
jgi:hypothetical protein